MYYHYPMVYRQHQHQDQRFIFPFLAGSVFGLAAAPLFFRPPYPMPYPVPYPVPYPPYSPYPAPYATSYPSPTY